MSKPKYLLNVIFSSNICSCLHTEVTYLLLPPIFTHLPFWLILLFAWCKQLFLKWGGKGNWGGAGRAPGNPSHRKSGGRIQKTLSGKNRVNSRWSLLWCYVAIKKRRSHCCPHLQFFPPIFKHSHGEPGESSLKSSRLP